MAVNMNAKFCCLLCFFREDGSTYGGQGPEIAYGFTATTGTTLSLDGTATYSNAQVYQSDGDDYTQTDLVANYTGFQRDEIYRIGIVFYNELGQASKVKWIGDVRFPCHTGTYNIDYLAERSQ